MELVNKEAHVLGIMETFTNVASEMKLCDYREGDLKFWGVRQFSKTKI